ncbi:MAG: VWA domain-containing protein [Gammaproteobacteria bacterium]|nr:VWA domain-containing protein [Gammaproteobacteria bacterium]NIR81612.1 VWA domain-containing protein [Gammaproteobacteria bacterium]NIR88163.1 VWA domain-containing protein [Gammaproteobacteria bacterium]NIU02724.1 VWA domain-containing protein [Gammaproteobacteria bacterium]NIV73323.1 VWA domain-containing protein [Gammaproteobacteria bacterium]
MRKRRGVNVFGLSFLDVMFCGFGSVILLVMIVNSQAVATRERVHEDLRGEVRRLEREVLQGERRVFALRTALEETRSQLEGAQSSAQRLDRDIERAASRAEVLTGEPDAAAQRIAALQREIRALEEDVERLRQIPEPEPDTGAQVRRFVGEGDRQYLTGLKMGGERVLILVDVSASMLERTIVNVIRVRNMDDATKRAATKWRRTLATVEWLVSQLPVTSRFQIHAFNTEARAVVSGSEGVWLKASERADVERAVTALRAVVPAGGTSLYHAFRSIGTLKPRPDNVILVTDGLPTQGSARPASTRVSGQERLQHFRNAVVQLPDGIPVNTILLPMEGDPMAPSAFWKLAAATRGSFIAPAEDWP